MSTTVANVKSIMETALTDPEITALIVIAGRMITNTLGSTTLAQALLDDIEMWLTAHLISLGKERQTFSEKVGDIWITYQGKFGKSLESSTYGQMVLLLDTSGLFQRGAKQKANIRATPQYSENYD